MAIDLPPPETIEQRKARQYSTLHHFGTMAHDLACDAHARAKEQLAPPEDPPNAPANSRIDYAATFASLFRAVRQAIALEHRLDAPPRTRARPAYRDAPLPPDPRRTLFRTVFHDAVAKQPDAARRRREIDHCIELEIEADPDQQVPIEQLVANLCNALQIDLDLTKVPDAFLGMPPRPRPYPTPS